MNYQQIYDNLISSRKLRKLNPNVYYENHHIIMRSLGGTDAPDNLVMLTAREHFIAHAILYRIFKNRKAALAFSMMCRGKNRTKISSRSYAEIREALSESQKGVNNSMYGKTISKKHRDKINKTIKGVPRTDEVKHKISIANKGKKRTIEFCLRMSLNHKGNINAKGHKYVVSEETKNKISIANKGKIHSEETKIKISNSKKGKSRPDLKTDEWRAKKSLDTKKYWERIHDKN